MQVRDGNIGGWQTGILLFVLMFANKILLLPSLLFEGAKVEALFIPIVFFAAEIGLLLLFYFLKKKFPHACFGDILRAHFSKVVQIVVMALIAIFFLSKAVLLYNVTFIFFRNLIYKDYSQFLFLFCFLPIINHLAIVGLRAMGRTLQLFFPLIVVITIFCVVVGFFGINSDVLLFQSTFGDVFITALRHISAFGDVIFVFVMMDKINIKKGEWKVVFSLMIASCVLVVVVMAVFIFSYTYTAFMHPYAIFDIMSYVKEYGGLGRLDIISMVVIIIFSYFQLAIYLKAFMAAFCDIFRNAHFVYSVLTFNLAFLLVIEVFVMNLEQAVDFGEKLLPFLGVVSFVLVPLAVILALFSKNGKRDRNGTAEANARGGASGKGEKNERAQKGSELNQPLLKKKFAGVVKNFGALQGCFKTFKAEFEMREGCGE